MAYYLVSIVINLYPLVKSTPITLVPVPVIYRVGQKNCTPNSWQ